MMINSINDLELHVETSAVLSAAKPGFSWLQDGEPIILGIPLDLTCTYRPGCRFGPDAVRLAAANLELGSMRLGTTIEDVGFSDLGNLLVDSVNLEEMLDKIEKVASVVYSSGHFPIFLGGEHSITPRLIPASVDGLGAIVLDAHHDLRDTYQGSKHSHATASRRVVERLGAEHVLIAGARGICKEEIEYMAQEAVKVISSKDMLRGGDAWLATIKDFARTHEKIYLSVDMDVFDPAYAPGVGNQEPEGITPTNALDIITCFDKEKFIGADVVETSPDHDQGQAAMLAARLVYEILNVKIGR